MQGGTSEDKKRIEKRQCRRAFGTIKSQRAGGVIADVGVCAGRRGGGTDRKSLVDRTFLMILV